MSSSFKICSAAACSALRRLDPFATKVRSILSAFLKTFEKLTALLAILRIIDRNRRNLWCLLWSQFDPQDKNLLPLLVAPLVRYQKQAMR